MNLCSYAGNNPVNYIDPTGHCIVGFDWFCVWWGSLFSTPNHDINIRDTDETIPIYPLDQEDEGFTNPLPATEPEGFTNPTPPTEQEGFTIPDSPSENEGFTPTPPEQKAPMVIMADPTGTQPAPAAQPTVSTPSSPVGPNFVATPAGDVIPVPVGATGPQTAQNGKGFMYTGGQGGANGQVDTVRIMDPVPAKGNAPAYPGGYVVYENAQRQAVDPTTGRTVPRSRAHWPLTPI